MYLCVPFILGFKLMAILSPFQPHLSSKSAKDGAILAMQMADSTLVCSSTLTRRYG